MKLLIGLAVAAAVIAGLVVWIFFGTMTVPPSSPLHRVVTTSPPSLRP